MLGEISRGHFYIPNKIDKMEEKLVVVVANHPVLYDQSLFTYRDTNRRNQAWREVAETVGETGRFSPVWGFYIQFTSF